MGNAGDSSPSSLLGYNTAWSVCHQGGEKDCEDIEGGLVMGEHWLLANSPWRQVRY